MLYLHILGGEGKNVRKVFAGGGGGGEAEIVCLK